MRVAIPTMIWKRPEVFELWAACVNRLIKEFPDVDIVVMVAGSEGKVSRDLVKAHGFKYIEVENMPLGRKANRRLQACKDLDPDYVLLLGSDDIVSPVTFKYLLAMAEQGVEEVVSMDLYYYDVQSRTAVHSIGYINHRKGEPMAVGRFVSKRVLEALDWRLWGDSIMKGLDGVSRNRLASIPHERQTYRLRDLKLMILDVKTSTNLTKFQMRPNYTEIPFSEIEAQFPDHELITALT